MQHEARKEKWVGAAKHHLPVIAVVAEAVNKLNLQHAPTLGGAVSGSPLRLVQGGQVLPDKSGSTTDVAVVVTLDPAVQAYCAIAAEEGSKFGSVWYMDSRSGEVRVQCRPVMMLTHLS
jgi:hypothetical protein